jgi:hypothetical protein
LWDYLEKIMGCELLAFGFAEFWWRSLEILAVVLLVLGAYLWIIQFAQLMALGDGDFPGRYDKALWVGAFVCTLFLAALAFVVWKKAMVAMRSERCR